MGSTTVRTPASACRQKGYGGPSAGVVNFQVRAKFATTSRNQYIPTSSALTISYAAVVRLNGKQSLNLTSPIKHCEKLRRTATLSPARLEGVLLSEFVVRTRERARLHRVVPCLGVSPASSTIRWSFTEESERERLTLLDGIYWSVRKRNPSTERAYA